MVDTRPNNCNGTLGIFKADTGERVLRTIIVTILLIVFLLSSGTASALIETPDTVTFAAGSGSSTGSVANLNAVDNLKMSVTADPIVYNTIQTLRPTSDTLTEWKATDCGGSHWNCVDDAITEGGAAAHDTTTYVTTSGYTTTKTDEYVLGNLAGGSWTMDITAVRLGIVAKQNETTTAGASTLSITLRSTTNTTVCDWLNLTVAWSTFNSLWFDVPYCRLWDWTTDVVNDTSIRIDWLAPYFNTVTITALALSVHITEIFYGTTLDTTWTPRPTNMTLSAFCDVTGAFDQLYVIVLFNGLPLSYTISGMDPCNSMLVLKVIPQPSGGGYGPTVGYLTLRMSWLADEEPQSWSADRWSVGTGGPAIPSSFEYIVIIGIIISCVIFVSYIIGRWLYD